MVKFLLLVVVAGTAAPGASVQNVPIERYYCTEYGPFFIRFDLEKAAGVYAVLTHDDLGAIVGTVNERTFSGRWFEVDNNGDITIEFSEDWASFAATYKVDGPGNDWVRGWTGRLRPENVSTAFDVGDVSFLCGS